jgi:indole-3-glycerol phosphate synthase
MTFLQEIISHQRARLSSLARSRPMDELIAMVESAAPPKDFLAALRQHPSRPALIAEVKRASPSQGTLTRQFDPARLARIYRQNGAAAISVLTESRYFQGDLAHLRVVASQPQRPPILRKDFILDPYQIYESRAAGADAVLLIVSMLSPAQLAELASLTHELGMSALVEVHTEDEIDTALRLEPELIGVNNRDLASFAIDLRIAAQLIPRIPPQVCAVAESGIRSPSDVVAMGSAGADAVLVGEALVRAADIAKKVRALSGARAHEN